MSAHADALYRAAWALCGSREDAEDLVQETFVRVLARPRMVRGDGDRAYLMRTLRNTYFTSRRTASRRLRTSSLDQGLEQGVEPGDPRSDGRPAEALEVKEIFTIVAELSEDFRLALVAVDIVGLSYREAAQALDVPEATITTRVYRARQQVARRFTSEPTGEARVLGTDPAAGGAMDSGGAREGRQADRSLDG